MKRALVLALTGKPETVPISRRCDAREIGVPLFPNHLDLRCFMTLPSIRVRFRRYRQILRRFVYHNLLHADDPPHPLALGMAVGMFVAFTPTIGVQMLIAGFLSWLLRANKALSITVVWISNPGTMLPIYWYCYRVGCALLALDPIGRAWWADLATPPHGWWPAVTFYWSRFIQIAWPLWLGGFVVGFVCAWATYYTVYHTIRSYRLRR